MHQERVPDETPNKEASLSQERFLADRVASIKANELDSEKLETRMATLLVKEMPQATLESFKDVWRRYVQEQLAGGRTFQEIWKSVVELDNSGREELGPDIPADEMYDRLNTAVRKILSDSPAAVEKVIRGVVLEFRPKRKTY